ncbi:hypothetical protein SADUNF_Sadunf04G0145000 [Salix dunnii]|uniref:Uncharacterized protein n=1 Tax=Salix dunnii TaxID=1413687 RepID=A0A835K5Q8_9ROSI|nr:hypothetical protein SADUNF_Sadunf04G0145000 [Salix dunnii]
MGVKVSRFAFYNLCPHAYIPFLRCGIQKGHQQPPAYRSSRCESDYARFSQIKRQEGACFAVAQMLDRNTILWNRRLKEIRETCSGQEFSSNANGAKIMETFISAEIDDISDGSSASNSMEMADENSRGQKDEDKQESSSDFRQEDTSRRR